MAAPIKFLSGRQQQQKIGVEGSTQNEKVLEVVGQVGIGTTIFDTDASLTVRGDAKISGKLDVGDIGLENLNISGISTFNQDVDVNSNVDISGITTIHTGFGTVHIGAGITALIVDGDTRITGVISAYRIHSDLHGEFTGSYVAADSLVGTSLSVSGISTLGITSITELTSQQLNVSGVSTLGVTTVTDLTAQNLVISGVTTTNGLLDIDGGAQVNNLTVEGLSENRIVIVGSGSVIEDDTNLTFDGSSLTVGAGLSVSGISTLGIASATDLTSQQLNVSGVSTFQDHVVLTGVGKSLVVGPSNDQLSLEHDADGSGLIRQNNELSLLSPSIQIGNLDATKTSASFSPTGAVELYHDNDKKFETTDVGIDVTGHTETDTLNVSGISTLSNVLIGSATTDFIVHGDARITGVITAQRIHSELYGEFTGSTVAADSLVGTSLSISGISTLGITSTTDLTSQQLNVSGISTLGIVEIYSGIVTATSGVVTYYGDGTKLDLTDGVALGGDTTGDYVASISGTANQIAVDVTSGEGTTPVISIPNNPTLPGTTVTIENDLQVDRNLNVTGVATAQEFVGNLTGAATSLSTGRNFEITGDVVASAVSFDGTGNVALSATIQPNSVELSTDTTGDYVASFTGTTNEIIVSNATGEGSTPQVGLDNNVSIQESLTVGTGLSVSGISTLGITSATDLTSQQLNVSGVSTLGVTTVTDLTSQNLNVSGVSTFIGIASFTTSDVYIANRLYVGGLEVEGGTGENVFSGVTTFTNQTDNVLGDSNIAAVQINGGLGVDLNTTVGAGLSVVGSTTLANAKVTGIITATALAGFDYLQAPHGSTVNFAVTVSSKSNHRYSGGSGSAYYINGIESPFLTLTPGRTYRFTLSSGDMSSHPFRFYLEADRTTAYTTNVTSTATYTEIVVTDTTPTVLHYQCSAHGYMGNAVEVNSNKVNTPYEIVGLNGANITGIVTAVGFATATGTSIQFLKADGSVDNNSYLTVYNETDPVVTAINGIVKSDGSTISAAQAGVDYLTDVSQDGTPSLNYNGNTVFEAIAIGVSISNGAASTATIAGPSNLIIDPGTVGDNTGTVRIKGDLFVDGTQTQINSTTIELADFVVGVATTATTDILADGAGIQIGPDNTFKYHYNSGTNPSLKSSENLNVASGKSYQIDQTEVLNATTLGSNVVNSSLTSVGTLGSLDVNGHAELDDVNVSGAITATTFTGNLSGTATTATNLANAANITTGTISSNRIGTGTKDSTTFLRGDNTFATVDSTALIDSNGATRAQANTSGVDITGIVTATTFSGNLSGTATTATNLSNAANITTGTISIDRLGSSGTKSSTTFLRGDNTFASVDVGDATAIIDSGSTIRVQATTSGIQVTGISTFSDDIDLTGTSDSRITFGSSGTSGTNDSNFIRANDTDIKINSASGGKVIFGSNGTDGVYIDNTNNVGIGTSIPTNAVVTSNTSILNVGVVTANYLYGDGAGLTNVPGSAFSNLVQDSQPQLGGNLDTNEYLIEFGDSSGQTNDRLKFGDSGDFQMFHNGTNSYITNNTGDIILSTADTGDNNGDDIIIQAGTNKDSIIARNNDAVELYHNDSKKFETTGYGVTVTGGINASGVVTATNFDGLVSSSNLSGALPAIDASSLLNLTGVTDAKTYGDNTTTPRISVDANGRITGITTVTTQGSNAITEVAGDSTPSLGGPLNLNNNNITGTANIGLGTQTPTDPVLSTNSSILHAGIVTAREFYGNGANLTGLAGGQFGSVVQDTDPTLGGDLDAANYNIDNVGIITATSLESTSAVVGSGVTIDSSGIDMPTGIVTASSIQANILRDGDGSTGTAGQVLSYDGSDLQWVDAAAADALVGLTVENEGVIQGSSNAVSRFNFTGDIISASVSGSEATVNVTTPKTSGEFFTGVSSSLHLKPLSYESAMFTFPSTANKQYIIESIHVANIDESVGVGTTANIIASIEDSSGEQTYIAYNVPILTGGAIDLLKNPIVAGPDCVIRMWSTNSAYVGVNTALDVYVNYTTETSSDYVSVYGGTTTINTTEATLYTSSGATMLEKIGLANRTNTGDHTVSIKITQGTTTSYLAKNLIIPRYATVDLLDRPKRIENGAKLEVEVGSTSTIDVIVAGKKI